MRKPTKAAGAAIERDLVRRWVRRQRARVTQLAMSGSEAIGRRGTLDALLAWLDAQPQRTRRTGGIGR